MTAINTRHTRPTFVANQQNKNSSTSCKVYSDSDSDDDSDEDAAGVTSTSISNSLSASSSSSSSDSSGIYGNETTSVLDHHKNYLLSQQSSQDQGSKNDERRRNQKQEQKQQRMCRYYLPSGCHLGNDCLYFHSHSHSHSHSYSHSYSHSQNNDCIIPMPPPPPTMSSTMASTMASATATATTNLLSDKNIIDLLKSAPCPNYHRGKCQYDDDQCRFGHFDFDTTATNSTSSDEEEKKDDKKKEMAVVAVVPSPQPSLFPLPPLRWGVIGETIIEIPPGMEFWFNDLIHLGKNKYELHFTKIVPPPSNITIGINDTTTTDSIIIPDAGGGVKVIKEGGGGGHWGEYASRDGTTFLKISGWEDIVNTFSIKIKNFLLLPTTEQAQNQQKDNDDKTSSSSSTSSTTSGGVSLPKTIDEITGLPYDIDTLGRQCGFWQLIVRHQQQQKQQQQKHGNTNTKNENENGNTTKNNILNLQRRSKQCGNRIRLDFITDVDAANDNDNANANANIDAKNTNGSNDSNDSNDANNDTIINLMRVKIARQNYRNAIITAKKITKELDLFLSL
jgi:hypothetical protein